MGIGVDNVEQQCLECGRTCCNRRSLGNHVARSHKQLASLEKYVLKHNLNGIIPSCRCGCGKNVLWHKLLYCYNNFVNGHNPSNFIGFQHSAEQISYRNEQIRKTYETNPNLSDKIAASVVQAFKDPTKKKNLHDGQVRGWKDPVRRRKLSERNIAMLEAGIIGPQAPFKTQWILNPFTGKQEYMHSSWETAFLQQCAQKQLPVSKVHSIRIPYTDNKGKEHIYIPDFVTMSKDSKNFLFEIKGRETDIDKIKYTAATNWCNVNGYEFIVVYAVTASTTLST